MAITYIVGDKLRVNTSYIDAVLAKQTPSSYLAQSLEVLGDLNFEVLTVLATGTGDFPTSSNPVTLSYLQVVPATTSHPRYNGGNGVNVYFSSDTLLNNSFEYATAYIPDIVYVMGKNNTGSIIARGSVVRQSSYDISAQMPSLDLASAASAATASVLGVTVEDIAIGGTGGILIAGSYQGINTTGGTVGDPIYLSDTPSAMSISAGTVSVIIGSILSVGSTGSVRFGIGVDQGGGGGGGSSPWEEVATVVQLVTPTNSVLVQSGQISSPGSGASSEQYGAGSNAVADTSVAIGNGATIASGSTNSIAVGQGINIPSGNVNNIAIGPSTNTIGTGTDFINIGRGITSGNATNSGSDMMIFGRTISAAAPISTPSLVPTIVSNAGTPAGTFAAGTYSVTYTFLDGNGNETLPYGSPPYVSVATIANDSINFSITISGPPFPPSPLTLVLPPGVESINVYAENTPGSGVLTLAGNISSDSTGNITTPGDGVTPLPVANTTGGGGVDTIIIGHDNTVYANYSSVVMGHHSFVGYVDGYHGDTVAIGSRQYINRAVGSVSASQIVAIGNFAGVQGSYGTVVGYGARSIDHATALGWGAQSTGPDETIAIGYDTRCTGGFAVAIGGHCQANANYSTAIGRSAYVDSTALNSTAIGYTARTLSTAVGSIALGDYSTAYGPNQCVIGSWNSPIKDVYLGNGITEEGVGVPESVTIHATSGSTAGLNGASLTLQSGLGGAATDSAGSVIIQTATSGTAATTPTTRITISATGQTTFATGAEWPITTKTSTGGTPISYNAAPTDWTILCECSAAGGTVTITLPTTAATGRIYNIKKIDATAENVIIDGNGNNIDASGTKTFNTQWESYTVQFNGTAWFILF